MLIRPSHEYEEEFGEMAKGDVGGHAELAVDGRLDASKSDAKSKLLYVGAREEVGIGVDVVFVGICGFGIIGIFAKS